MNRFALMLACVAGLLAAGCSGVVRLHVRRERSHDPGEYDSYRNTQAELIKSPHVLTAALRQPGIASLPTLSGQPDPVGWLARTITVVIPAESEVLQVRLRGDDAREAALIVNAVAQAYLSDVVNKDRTERLARRDELEKKYKENMAEVREKLEIFNNLARKLGTRDSAEAATQRSLLLDHLGVLRKEIVDQRRDIVAIDAELAAIEAMKDVPPAEGQPALPNPAALRARREVLAKHLEEISREFDQVAREVTALGNANADLEARRIEIAELQAVTDQLGTQLNEVEADIEMPNRVELIEEAAGG